MTETNTLSGARAKTWEWTKTQRPGLRLRDLKTPKTLTLNITVPKSIISHIRELKYAQDLELFLLNVSEQANL